jgi:hypothetical protein
MGRLMRTTARWLLTSAVVLVSTARLAVAALPEVIVYRDNSAKKIYQVDPAGTAREQLLRQFGETADRALPSPDGMKILLYQGGKLFTAEPSGNNATDVTTSGFIYSTAFAWSPSGTQIAFAARTSTLPIRDQVYIMGSNGSSPTAITPMGAGPQRVLDWGAPGILYRDQYTSSSGKISWPLWNVNPATSARTRLLPETWSVTDARYSPDGTKIAFLGADTAGTTGTPPDSLWVMNADGSSRTAISFSPSLNPKSLDWKSDGTTTFYNELAVSAKDPTQLAYYHVYNLNITTGAATPITVTKAGSTGGDFNFLHWGLLSAANNPPDAVAVTATAREDVPKAVTLTGTDVDGQDLTFTIVTPPAHGTVTQTSPISCSVAGSTSTCTAIFSYVPAANYFGPDSFTYTVNDGNLTSAPATVDLTITPVNDAPSFTPGANQSVLEDAGLQTVDPWATAISKGPANESAQALTFTVTNNNNALFSVQPTINAAGRLVYTPKPGVSGAATVTVELKDDGGTADGGVDTSTAHTFTITVIDVNDAPSFTKGTNPVVLEDSGPQTFAGWATAISAGPPSESGQTLNFTVTNDNNGLFQVQPALSAAGVLTFTPAPNANGTATVTVVLRDNGGTANGGDDTADPQTFTITVTSVNDAPAFTKGADESVVEGSGSHTVTGWATGISAGPADEVSQTLSFVLTNTNTTLFSVQPAIDPTTGNLTYTLAPGKNGTATVSVVLQDNGGTLNGGANASAAQTFTITVEAVNDAPSFTAGPNQTVLEDAPAQVVNGWASAISAGPPDEASQTLTFTVTNDNNSLFSVQPAVATNGRLTYTLAPNANGSATVSVVLKDNGGTLYGGDDTSDPQTFTITVTPVNDAPSFTKGSNQTVAEDAGAQTATGWATAISAGPSDESGQTLSFIVTNDNNALFSVQPAVDPTTGNLTTTPAADAYGVAAVTVRLQDNGGTANSGADTSAAQTFTITVSAVNDAPSFTGSAGPTVLEDAGAQTVPAWATAISKGPANESAQTLTFVVTGNSNPALFSVGPAVTPANGNLTFTPAPNANGTADVTVVLKDNGLGTDTSAPYTFTITVTAVNDAPSFTKGANQVVDENAPAQTVNGWATALSPGPADEVGQALTFLVSNDNSALFSVQPAIDSNGNLTYTPAAAANGTANVTVRLQDNGGTANSGVDTSAAQTFTISIIAVNDAPSFTKGADETVLEDSGSHLVTGWATNILAGPANESSQVLDFQIATTNNALFTTPPAVDPATGNLTYTLAPNANGVATVTVRLHDNGGTANGGVDTSAPQTFTITVKPVNDEPSFTKGTNRTVLEDAGAQTVPGWATAISKGPANESGQTLTFTVTTDNDSLFSVLPAIDATTGTLTFTPAANANGVATVTVVLSDNGGVADGGDDTYAPQTFTITVDAVNDAPSFNKGADDTVLEDAGAQTRAGWATAILAGPPDEAGQALTFTVTSNSNPALFSVQPAIAADGTLTYTPAPDASGTATIQVVLKDNGGTANGGVDTSAARSFLITVQDVNDAPSFTKGANPTVLEDAGLQTFPGWATAISPGSPSESGQTLAFVITTGDDALFTTLPAINPTTGNLSFRTAPDANGTVTVTVELRDNGGTANGGDNASDPQTFTITITPVNDAPAFTKGANENVIESTGLHTVPNWATAISKGPADESAQTLAFLVSNDNNSLFSVQPAMAADGTLSYTLAPGMNGSATVTVSLQDNGGVANGGDDTSDSQIFTITVTGINDAPSFTKGADQAVLEDSGPHSVSGWATAISKGPADENGQTLTFLVSNDNNALFSTQPAIAADGTLTYTLTPHAHGSATVTVRLKDNGGTDNGGDDESDPQTFTITVTAVNDEPSFTKGADVTVLEDAPAQSLANWATAIVAGPADEQLSQTLTWTVTNDNNALFTAQPQLAADGTLTFTPAPGANGTATVSVALKDNGGTLNGGDDTYGPVTFTITVTAVNDTPSFTAGPDRTVLEDSGAQTFAGWATAISKGPADESGQTLTFVVTNDNSGLFSVQPDVDEATGTLTFTPAPNANGTATVTVVLKDNGGGADTSAAQTFVITVTPVNDEPRFTSGGNQLIEEDSPAQTVSNWATAMSKGPADENGQTLTWLVSNNNNALFTVQPALAADGTLTYTPAPGANGTAIVSVELRDDGGTANGGDDTFGPVTFTITIVAINDAPTFTISANDTVLEDSGLRSVPGFASNISAGAPNESGQVLTFVITSPNSPLFAVQPAIAADGTLTYTPAPNAFGTATITVELHDDGDTLNGGDNTSDPQTFTITVDPVNDEPSFTKGANQTVLEDAVAQTVTGWATAISKGPANESGQVLTFAVTTNNDALFSVLPAIHPTTGDLTYTPAANANGTATVSVVLTDNGGTANGGDDTYATQTFTITVTAVNDAPDFTPGANPTVLEGAPAQTLANWATGITAGPADEQSTQTLTFTVTNNSNSSLFAVAPAIAADGTLTFTPAADAFGTATIEVRLQDNGGTANGGVDSVTKTFTITVTGINDAPSFDKGTDPTVLEDAGAQSFAGWATNIVAGPANESGQALTFNIDSNSNSTLFSVQPVIAANGTLTFTPAPNANGTATIMVSLSDNGGTANGGSDTSAQQSFTITVTPVNDVPSFTKGADQSVVESTGTHTVPNWATAISKGPADENGQNLTFEVVSNTNTALFSTQPAIAADGTLSYTLAPGMNGSATIEVRLHDDGGTANFGVDTSASQTFTITVTGINDAPSFTKGADQAVLEDSGPHSVSGWATAISKGPADENGQTLTFLVSNDNNALFSTQPAIAADGTLTYTLTPHAHGSATVTVRLKDNGGTDNGGDDESDPQTFTITVTAVNDEPSFTKGADVTVLEDAPAQSLANWATAIVAGPADEQLSQTLTWTVTNDNNALFTAQPQLAADGTLTFTPAPGANGTATVSVALKDNGGTLNGGDDTYGPVTFTITVTAVNDTPSFTAGPDRTVLEDSGAQTFAGWATAISKGPADESGQTLTFVVTNDNSGLFSVQPDVDEATGTLTFTPAPNANGTATVTVVLKDNGGGADTSAAQTFVITVTPVNDEPRFTSGGNQLIEEDSPAQTVSNWATAMSKGPADENGQTLTWLVSNNNNALFTAQPALAADGTLTYTPAPGANGTAIVSVELRDDGGTANGGDDTFGPVTFTITITAINDAPTFTISANDTVLEDSGARTVPGFASNISAGAANESGQVLTFVITSPNSPLFAVQPAIAADGTLTYTPAADAFGTATITVELHDDGDTLNGGDNTSDPLTFTITVDPVNDEPSFTKGANQTVLEDTVAQTVTGWATAISKGPANESGQVLTFAVTTNNDALFSVLPAIHPTTGDLTYTPAANANGTATVSVVLTDNGGTANGGDDTYATQTFTITVTAVNDAPDFTPGANPTVLEGAPAQTLANWATGITAGPADEQSTQTLTFTVTNNSNSSLFAVAPAIAADGTLTFTPAADAFGTATIEVRLQDNGGMANGGVDSVTKTFTITVTGINDAPSFTAGSNPTVLEDAGAQSFAGWATNIVAGPANESGQALTFKVTGNSNPSLFSAAPQIAADGTLTFTAAADANGSATITVVLEDNGGTANGGSDTSAPVTFIITVTPVNDVPSFTKGADENVVESTGLHTVPNWATAISKGPADESTQTLTFQVSNDNNSLFSVQPAIAADGTLTYTLAPGMNGSATVTVSLQDSGGVANGGDDTSDPQTFTIVVTTVNDAPSFTKGADQSVLEDSGPHSVPGWATNISPGPADESGQTVSFTVTNNNNALFLVQPAIASNGTLTYTLAPNAHGTATVTVVAKDNGGTANGGDDEADPQTFTVTVGAVNDEPSFTKGADVTVAEDDPAQTRPNWATAISAGPADEQLTQTLTWTVTNDNNALFSAQPQIAANGTLTFTPAPGANGTATVSVVLKDNGGTLVTGDDDTYGPVTFTITVTAVNDPPTFTGGPDRTVLEDSGAQTFAGWATAISKGPADENGQTLTFVVTNDNNGLFSVQPDVDEATGTLTFTPAPDANGSATVTVVLKDNGGGADTSAPQTFVITVTPVNDEPGFTPGANQLIDEDSPAQTVNGWATALSKGPANESTQVLTFTVTNDNNGLFSVQPALAADGTLTYTPAPGANGTATVSVELQDNGGTANGGDDTFGPVTFTITITAINDAPTFTISANDTVLEDSGARTVPGFASNISAGAANESGQVLTFVITSPNSPLFAVQPAIAADGTLTYTPAADAFGTATITVELHDDGDTLNGGDNTSDPLPFTITVDPVNDEPSFTPGGNDTVLEDSGARTVPGWATNLSNGPANESGQVLTFTVTTNNDSLFSVLPAINQTTGDLTYTPAANANGTATVTVVLTDNGGTANGGDDTYAIQTFTITVTAVNDAPNFTPGANPTVLEGAPAQTLANWATGITAGPADEQSTQTLTFTVTNNSNPGLFSAGPQIAADGTLTFTPAADAFGTATIEVRLQDNGGMVNGGVDSVTKTFTITVTGINDAPSFDKGTDPTVLEDSGAQTFAGWATNIVAGPANESGQNVTFNIDSNSNSTLFSVQPAIAANGTLTFTPAPNANGTATITVSLSDNGGTANGGSDTSAQQSFTITVTPVNDVPSFTKGADENVIESTGLHTVPNWATAISKGPADESAQTLAFLVSNDNNSLFSVQPAIAADGTLTYTLAPGMNGSATITVSLQDSGGVANGGDDTSDPQTFTIVVTTVNDAPSFTKGADQSVLEDSGPHSVPGWATNISPGPADESGQTVSFTVTNNNNALFLVQPAIASNGTLTYTLAPNAHGTATVTVVAKDNGGTANGGDDEADPQTFTITVGAVNDEPSFTKGADVTVAEDDPAQTRPNWATAIIAGPADEQLSQTLSWTVTNDNNALFTAQPQLAADGTLTFTPAPGANGTATVSVALKDNGGTLNGGDDTYGPVTFTITVTAVNDTPSFTAGPDRTVLEDSGAQTFAGWATAISKGPADENGQTLTFLVSNDNNGLFSVQPDVDEVTGTLTFTPAPDANGTATVTVRLQDNGGGADTSAAQTFVITVDPVNDEPSFTKGADQLIDEDSPAQTVNGWATALSKGPANESTQALTFTVTNDRNDLFTVQPAIAANGMLTYTPAPGANGTATVTVTLTDNGGTANSGDDSYGPVTFTITITAINDAPTFTISANDTVLEDSGARTVPGFASNISAGAANESGQVLTFVITSPNSPLFAVQPAIAADGTLTYTPAPNAFGTATITVELHDDGDTLNGGDNTSAPQTFTITVDPVNDEPSFTKGANQTVLEDAGAQTVAGWATAISKGPANESGQTLTFTVTTNNDSLFSVLPAIHPTTGNLTYTPAANANGTATVTVVLTDNGGTANGGDDTYATQTFTITVTAVNDAPNFTPGADPTVLEGAPAQTLANWATGITAGPADEQSSQTLSFVITSPDSPLFAVQPAIAADGTLTFTPAADAFGTATIEVRLQDNGGTANGGVDSVTKTFTITVTGINDAPSFDKGTDPTVLEDSGAQTFAGWATNIVAGPANESGQNVTFNIDSNTNPTLFSVQPAIAPNGTLTFTPAANANGTATITVTLKDDGGTANSGVDTSAPQSFTITVTAVNDVPSFTKGADQSVVESTGTHTVPNWATAISKGPADENGQNLTFEIVSNTNTTLFSTQPAIAADGTLSYTLAPGMNGSATIQVRLRDDGGTANSGVDTSASQTFVIYVTEVNDPPSFTPGADQSVREDSGAQSVGWATGISAGPADEVAQALTFAVITNTNSSLFSVQPAIAADGTLTYTPAPDAFGSADITIELRDNGGTLNGGDDTSAQHTFTITVRPVNDRPSFTKGANQSVLEDSGPHSVAGWATGISKGPANESTQNLTWTVTNNNAALFSVPPQLAADGTLTYTLAPGANGTATVTVDLKDDGGTADGGQDTAIQQTFTITVTAVNDPPTFTGGGDRTVLEDSGARTFAGWATNIVKGPADESGQTLTFSVTANSNPTLFSVLPAVDPSTGTLTFTPAPNAHGSASITIVLRDNGGGADSSLPYTFTITVDPVNDRPTFTGGGNVSTPEDQAQSLAGWATAISPGPNEAGQTVTFNVTNYTNPGLFLVPPTIAANGTLTYTPTANLSGTSTVTVVLTDNGGTANGGFDTSAPAYTFTITVLAVNDQPSFTDAGNVTVLEDALAQTVNNWASNIVKGPADESGQTVSFTVNNNNNSLFSVQPAVAPNGTLTFTPASQAFGTATVTVVMTDSGGTANGGVNASVSHTFTITVDPVNDVPIFSIPNTPDDVNENAGLQTRVGWATGISAGQPNESGQTLTFEIIGNSNPTLFTTQPAIASNGTLTYQSATNAVGTAIITVRLRDNGGTANGGVDVTATQTFTIRVQALTTLTVPDVTAQYGQTATIQAKLTRTTTGAGINLQPVTLVFKGSTYNLTTNASGDVSISFTVTDPPGTGPLPITATYAGVAGQYAFSNGSGSYSVAKSATTLAFEGKSGSTLNVDYSDRVTVRLMAGTIPVAGRTITFTGGGTSIGTATTDTDGYATPTWQNNVAQGTAMGSLVASFAGDGSFFASTDTVTGNSVVEAGVLSGTWSRAGNSSNYRVIPSFTEVSDGATGNVANGTLTIVVETKATSDTNWTECGTFTATPAGATATWTAPTEAQCISNPGWQFRVRISSSNYYTAPAKIGTFTGGNSDTGTFSVVSPIVVSGGTTTLSAGFSGASPVAQQPVLMASASLMSDVRPSMFLLQQSRLSAADSGTENSKPTFPPGLVGKPIYFYVGETLVGEAPIREDGSASLDYQVDLPAGAHTIRALFKGHAELMGQEATGTLTVNARSATLVYTGDVKAGAGEFTLRAALTDNAQGQMNLTRAGSVQFRFMDAAGSTLSSESAPVDSKGIAQTRIPALPAGAVLVEVSLAPNGYFEADAITVPLAAGALQVQGAQGQYSDKVTLQAQLSQTAAGARVEFFVAGRSVGTAEVSDNGAATLSYTIAEATGSYAVKAVSSLDGAEGFATLTVRAEQAELVYTGSLTVEPEGSALAVTVVQEADGHAGDLSRAMIRFTLKAANGSTKTYDAPVTADGTAAHNLKGLEPGRYTVTFALISDRFAAAEGTQTLMVKGYQTELTLGEPESRGGSGFRILATLSANGQPLKNQTLTVTYGETTQTVKTDKNGQAWITIRTGLPSGTFTVTVTFEGDDSYQEATASVALTAAIPVPGGSQVPGGGGSDNRTPEEPGGQPTAPEPPVEKPSTGGPGGQVKPPKK